MDTILSLLERFKEPSSWAGIGVLLSLFGVNIAPEGMTQIVAVITAICGVLAFFLNEHGKHTPTEAPK
jgi:hypothetical protein